jgi:hypothetical protein
VIKDELGLAGMRLIVASQAWTFDNLQAPWLQALLPQTERTEHGTA